MQSTQTRVLYVEDHEDARELVTLLLARHNCAVTGVESSDQALALARDGKFDLYLIDNWLPGESGIELCQKLREFDSTTPVLFYSAAAYDDDKEKALQSGAQAYLTKPAEPHELTNTIFRLISESRES